MEPQGRGLAEEPGILKRCAQGCVEPSRGLDDPNVPLSVATGAARFYIFELVERVFSEVELLLYGVLRRSPAPSAALRVCEPVGLPSD
jgi:hypothetical protein